MHNRALSDARFASSAGEARCPGSQPGASPQAPLPARLPTQAAQPGAPAYLAAGCQRSGGASSASPPRLLHRSERHVPGLRGRTPGNYYGLGRGKGGGGQREGVGGRAAAFYSPPKPPPATEHAQLPGFAPRRTFHERTQLFRVFAAAGGRLAVAAAVGGGGSRGECLHSAEPGAGRKQPLAKPVTQLLYPGAGAAPARPLRIHSGFAEILCKTNVGPSFAKEESKEGRGGGAERQIPPLTSLLPPGPVLLKLQRAIGLKCKFRVTGFVQVPQVLQAKQAVR